MGADTFFTTVTGKTADEAFQHAVDHARHERGHGGYTGTIAEKSDFRTIDAATEAPKLIAQLKARIAKEPGDAAEMAKTVLDLADPAKRANAVAYTLIDHGDSRVDDKWGPAGCIRLGPTEWLFFGWASS